MSSSLNTQLVAQSLPFYAHSSTHAPAVPASFAPQRMRQNVARLTFLLHAPPGLAPAAPQRMRHNVA